LILILLAEMNKRSKIDNRRRGRANTALRIDQLAHNFSLIIFLHFVYAKIMYFSRTTVLLAALTFVSADTLVEEKNTVVSNSDASPTMKRYLKKRVPVRSLSLFMYMDCYKAELMNLVCLFCARQRGKMADKAGKYKEAPSTSPSSYAELPVAKDGVMSSQFV